MGRERALDDSSDRSALHECARRAGTDVDTVRELTADDLEEMFPV